MSNVQTKITGAVQACRGAIVAALGPLSTSPARRDPTATDCIGRARHLLWMCDEVDRMLEDDSPRDARGLISWYEKIMRWLGFLQGTMWAWGLFTIDEMREHNR